jgi:hypothetical protein
MSASDQIAHCNHASLPSVDSPSNYDQPSGSSRLSRALFSAKSTLEMQFLQSSTPAGSLAREGFFTISYQQITHLLQHRMRYLVLHINIDSGKRLKPRLLE